MNSTQWIQRGSVAFVYIFFGALKIFGVSPASELVQELYRITIQWLLPFDAFMIVLGVAEVVLGALILVPKLTRLACGLLFAHIAIVCLPIIVLPAYTWTSFLVPTLEGQYILKNALLFALVWTIWKDRMLQ